MNFKKGENRWAQLQVYIQMLLAHMGLMEVMIRA